MKLINKIILYTLLGLIALYRVTLSAVMGRSCRFRPTCSEYARDAILAHGPWRGGLLALRRIGSCHPWNGRGFDFDPVPDCAITRHDKK